MKGLIYKSYKIVIIHVKDVVRRVLYFILCVSHIQGSKKNIVLFSTRRGGSTWLSQIISSGENKLRYYDHVLSWYQTDFLSRRIFPVGRKNQEIWPNEFNVNYIELINKGDHIARTIINPFSVDFVRCSDRILYKITEGKGLFNWVINNSNFHVIYQLRHPIPTSLSIMRLGWGLTIESYINNERFVREYLQNGLLDYCKNIVESNDTLMKHVLNWVLENLIPLRSKNINKVIIISYEETLLYPDKITDLIVKECDIEKHILMKQSIYKPSRSAFLSAESSINHMKKKNADYLLRKWKYNMSDLREKELMEILVKFDIDIYSLGNYLPHNRYLN